MLRFASALGLVVALSGCADNAGAPPSPTGPSTSGTALTISVTDGAETSVSSLECDPPGGDHPDPRAACRVLAPTAPDLFAPLPADAVCGQVYGGPQQAQITGSWHGEPVDAAFSLVDSCQISRWEALVPVLPASRA